jgi:hypothetical protein
MQTLMRTNDAPLAEYLRLDDAVMWTALDQFRAHRDGILSDLSERLLSRKLLKAVELFGDDATPDGRERCLNIAIELCSKARLDPEYYVGLDAPTAVTFDESNDPLSVVFPGGVVRKPSEVSFLLSRLRGQSLSRPRIIYPIEIREKLHLALAQQSTSRSSGATPEGTLAGGSFHMPQPSLSGALSSGREDPFPILGETKK